jgi:hypothetical protein
MDKNVRRNFIHPSIGERRKEHKRMKRIMNGRKEMKDKDRKQMISFEFQ